MAVEVAWKNSSMFWKKCEGFFFAKWDMRLVIFQDKFVYELKIKDVMLKSKVLDEYTSGVSFLKYYNPVHFPCTYYLIICQLFTNTYAVVIVIGFYDNLRSFDFSQICYETRQLDQFTILVCSCWVRKVSDVLETFQSNKS